MLRNGILAALAIVLLLVGVRMMTQGANRGDGSVERPFAEEEGRDDPERGELDLPEIEGGAVETPITEAAHDATPAPRTSARSAVSSKLTIPLRFVDDRDEPLAEVGVRWQIQGTHESYEQSFETEKGDLDLEVTKTGEWLVTPHASGHRRAERSRFLLLRAPHEGDRRLVRFLRNGEVYGRVIDGEGRTYAGVRVGVDEPGNRHGEGVETDEGGRFHLPDVPAGSKQAHVEAPLGRLTVDFELEPGGTAEVDLVISPGGFIRGTVYGEDDEPVEDGGVMLATDVEVDGTDVEDDGTFAIGPLTAGEYTIFAMYEVEKQPVLLPRRSVTVVAGETTVVDFHPNDEETHSLEGRVFHGSELQVQCRIMAFDEGRGLLEGFRAARTDDEGRYSVELSRPGPHLFLFDPISSPRGDPIAPQRVEITPGLHELDFHLPLGEITGKVLDAKGYGKEGVHVIAHRDDGYLDQLMPFEDGSARTDDEGVYRLPYLDEGTYTVMAFGGDVYRKRTGVHVKGGKVEGIDLEARPRAYVEGNVLDAEGQPVDKAVVFVRDEDGTILWGHKDDTNEEGHFGIPVPAGNLTFFARRWGAASEEVGPITIAPGGKVDDLEIRVVPSGRIQVLTSFEGRPAPASVRIFDDEGRDVSRAEVSFEGMAGVLGDPLSSTDQRIGPLPPGKYRIEATSPSGRTAQRKVTLKSEDLEVKLRF